MTKRNWPKPPDSCPRCGRPMANRSWHSYIGHLGLHGTADHHFSGDMRAAWQAFTLHPVVPFAESKRIFHERKLT